MLWRAHDHSVVRVDRERRLTSRCSGRTPRSLRSLVRSPLDGSVVRRTCLGTVGAERSLIDVSLNVNGRSMANACAIALILVGSSARSLGAIKQCKTDEERCMEAPAGSKVIAPPEAETWERRATEALLAEHARDLAKWSREFVVVAADLAVRMPRHHRHVSGKRAGEAALLSCGRETALGCCATRDSPMAGWIGGRGGPNGSLRRDL